MELGHDLSGQPLLYLHRVYRAGFEGLAHLIQLGARDIGHQLEVVHHQVVLEAHDLEVGVLWRLVDAYVVVKALAHAQNAVGAHQDGDHEALLRPLAHHGLQLPPQEQVELLVRTTELHVRLDDYRVVGLEQGVQKLGDGYGPVGGIPFGEVVPGQKLGHGEPAGELYDIGQAELTEPLALPPHLGPVPVHHLEELVQIGLSVVLHLLGGKHRPGGRLAAGVTDLCGPVPDYQDHPVPQLLELPELTEANCVAQVDVGAARVEAHLEPEGLSRVQELVHLLPNDDLGHAPAQQLR